MKSLYNNQGLIKELIMLRIQKNKVQMIYEKTKEKTKEELVANTKEKKLRLLQKIKEK